MESDIREVLHAVRVAAEHARLQYRAALSGDKTAMEHSTGWYLGQESAYADVERQLVALLENEARCGV